MSQFRRDGLTVSATGPTEEFIESVRQLGLEPKAAARMHATVPPRELRAINAAEDEEKFLLTGAQDAAQFLQLYTLASTFSDLPPARGPRRVLDFGCGCGRLTRFMSLLEGVEVYGADVNPDLVGWCAANLPDVKTVLTGYQPPLPFADSTFDFIYSLSVFSHLETSAASAWIAELTRVLAPAGMLLLTVHGRTALELLKIDIAGQANFRLDVPGIDRLIERLPVDGSIFLQYEPDVLAMANAGPTYGTTFLDWSYMKSAWGGDGLEPVQSLPGQLRRFQDIAIFKRVGPAAVSRRRG